MTPSVAPEPGFNDDESGAHSCLRHCKEVSSSEYFKMVTEQVDRVRICNMIFTYPSINPFCWQFLHVVPLHRGLVQYEPASPAPPRLALRGSFIGASCQRRDHVPLNTGSFINMGIRDPTATVGMIPCILDKSQAVTLRTLDIHPFYKGVKAYASLPPPLLLLAPRVLTPKTQAPTPQILQHVRIRRKRPVGGLLDSRGGHYKA